MLELGRMIHNRIPRDTLQYIIGASKNHGGTLTSALLVYYSEFSRDRLEFELRSRGVKVHAISGRAEDAVDSVRTHPADVVVIDKDAADISITQAVRQIAHILPRSLIFTAGASPQDVDVYHKGYRVGTVDLEDIR